MTKSDFKEYKGTEVLCESCGRILPTKCFSYKSIRQNNTALRCKRCDWLKRHETVPKIEGFSEEEIIKSLDFLLFQESIYANNLANKINRNLDDTIFLIQKLNVGNKHCVVKSKCECCGKEIENLISVYIKTKHLYCSTTCYWKHKPETGCYGKNHPQYNRIKTNCTYCGKEIEVIPYDYNSKNKFGDNHNFCSKECYWKYRSKYYIGNKSPCLNRKLSSAQIDLMREAAIKKSKNSERFNSKIQLKVNDILDRNNIRYEREYIIKHFAADNYLLDYNLIIEVMGDYWHTSPLRYNKDKYLISKLQQRGLQHDKQKHTYIRNHLNIEILYLWEYDIDNNPVMCEELIKLYIKRNGILPNYHSFNWKYSNDVLHLNKKTIIPYQDMKTDEYRNLIKKKVG
jgi:hypothetical protein